MKVMQGGKESNDMAAANVEQSGETKGNPATGKVERASRRQASGNHASTMTVRFFLAKAEQNGNAPAFDQEMPSEAEALIESLKTGRNYYSVIEWRAIADCSGRAPQVKKELVGNLRKGGG